MIYKVTAKFNFDEANQFFQLIHNGTIFNQKPEGKEIVSALHRARLQPDDMIIWTEVCYCSTPLAHERETVFDRFFWFENISTVNQITVFDGKPFLDVLASLTDKYRTQ